MPPTVCIGAVAELELQKFTYNSITEASHETGVSVTSISNNINGLSKTTKKGVWKIYQQKNLELGII